MSYIENLKSNIEIKSNYRYRYCYFSIAIVIKKFLSVVEYFIKIGIKFFSYSSDRPFDDVKYDFVSSIFGINLIDLKYYIQGILEPIDTYNEVTKIQNKVGNKLNFKNYIFFSKFNIILTLSTIIFLFLLTIYYYNYKKKNNIKLENKKLKITVIRKRINKNKIKNILKKYNIIR